MGKGMQCRMMIFCFRKRFQDQIALDVFDGASQRNPIQRTRIWLMIS
jgi:hypothetical protein